VPVALARRWLAGLRDIEVGGVHIARR
jgi:hypothetical protein